MTKLSATFGDPHPVALVTGSGADRIGNVIACDLAARGYRVVLHAHRSLDRAQQTVQELTRRGSTAVAYQADLRNDAEVDELIQKSQQWHDRLDVLVNSAAIWHSKPLEEVSADDVREHLEVNTVATFRASQQAGLIMVNQEYGGAIVNLGDCSVTRPNVDYSAYFPSKGALPTMTRSLAIELATRNRRVRVNAALPGPVGPNLDPQATKAASERCLLRRVGTPGHVSDAVIFLIENDFITGVCLPIDGGRTICG